MALGPLQRGLGRLQRPESLLGRDTFRYIEQQRPGHRWEPAAGYLLLLVDNQCDQAHPPAVLYLEGRDVKEGVRKALAMAAVVPPQGTVRVQFLALGWRLPLDARCGRVDCCGEGRRNQRRRAKGGDDMNMLWIGVLAGMIVCVGPEWLKILTFVVAVLFSGLLVHLPVHGHGHLHATANPWVLAIGGVGFGVWSWHYARKRGLQHLGAAELNTRWTNVRRMSKWGW
jgi:hypothetical protein